MSAYNYDSLLSSCHVTIKFLLITVFIGNKLPSVCTIKLLITILENVNSVFFIGQLCLFGLIRGDCF